MSVCVSVDACMHVHVCACVRVHAQVRACMCVCVCFCKIRLRFKSGFFLFGCGHSMLTLPPFCFPVKEYIPVLSRPQVLKNAKAFEWGNIYKDHLVHRL